MLLVGAKGQTKKRLRDLGVMSKIPIQNILYNRTTALQQAFTYIAPSETGHPNISSL